MEPPHPLSAWIHHIHLPLPFYHPPLNLCNKLTLNSARNKFIIILLLNSEKPQNKTNNPVINSSKNQNQTKKPKTQQKNMPANHQRDQNNPPTTQGLDDTPLLNPEIDDESPVMFRRRRAEDDEEAQNDDGPRPNPRSKGPAWTGEYAKSIVYGGLDAIVTSFSLISSISAGGRLSSVDVLVLGFANLVADGISMGFGDFVSSSTEKNMAAMERDVTHWEVENHRGSKIMHLIRRYRALGMDPKDATTVVNIFSKYKHIMVEEEMMGQKGILPPDQNEGHKPWKSGLVTFTAFLVFGSAPLLSFIVLIPFTNNDTIKFAGACILSALALALLGLAKARISGESYGLSALVTLSNGAIAAAVAYSIGWTLRNVAGLEEP